MGPYIKSGLRQVVGGERRYARRRAVLQALFVTFLWSTSWVLIKIGLAELPPLTFAGLRYALAFLVLLPWFLRREGGAGLSARLGRRGWATLAALGVVMYAITQGAQFVGLAYLPAVTVNLALGLTSVVVALVGIVLLAERPGVLQWLGIAISLVGAYVYFSPVAIPAGQAPGYVAAGVGVLANAGAALLGRAVNRRGDLSPLAVTTVSMGLGSGLLLAAGVGLQGMPPLALRHWVILVWLAVVNTAWAFTLWNRTLRTLSAVESSVINNSMMVQIPILAVVFLGERLTGRELVGLAVAVVGIALVQLRRGREVSGGRGRSV